VDARPSFDYYYLNLAKAVSLRGDCTRSQVGCVIVNGDHLVMPGYNGTPEHGQPGCLQGACPRGRLSYGELPAGGSYDNCIALHAEMNALKKIRVANAKDYFQDATAYVTREPCRDCHVALADFGIGRVVWETEEMWKPGGRPASIFYTTESFLTFLDTIGNTDGSEDVAEGEDRSSLRDSDGAESDHVS
jgi:dCMP deaminase